MKIRLSKDQAKLIGEAALQQLGGRDAFRYRDDHAFDLATMKPAAVVKLQGLLAAAAEKGGRHGLAPALRDLDAWQAPHNAAGDMKARSVEQFAALVAKYISVAPLHWVFEQDRQDGDRWQPYYVADVKYSEGGRNETPPQTTITLGWKELGIDQQTSTRFRIEHIRGKTVAQALAAQGLVLATPERIAEHLAAVAAWEATRKLIGHQFLATGIGTDDVDGNDDDDDRTWRWNTDRHQLLRDTGPSRVVVDAFFESEKNRDRDSSAVQLGFWAGRSVPVTGDDDEDDVVNEALATGELVDEEVPVHPALVVFDLARHLRVRVHVDQLTPYVYDDEIGSKLVIDADRKALVKLLIETKGGTHQDIVKGKGGGAVVLLSGPPGTGKTLTAEVYAEAERRALYSVQCSQLGTDPDTLEAELGKVFRRGNRWQAVMLLDEADVYVHQRGDSLRQNAIVGVFLRILEYQNAVLFLTTNRPDTVDDAIASRCIARIDYTAPSASDQARIWRVLADVSGVPLADAMITDLVADNQGLSGRDIKNLLKLARLVPGGVTRDTIRFVRQFQPTRAKT
jgi:hypothetical protein